MNALSPIALLINHRRWKYRWRYLLGQTPWETDETPAEVLEFINATPPGKALDLGCGAGTHSLTLARHGWAVTGIDFVPGAVRVARKRAAESGLTATFVHADIARPTGLDGPFDFALDIGCLFALNDNQRECYARNLARLLRPGARYMLYAWLPWMNHGKPCGISPETVEKLFHDGFSRSCFAVGEEKGRASAWYWYQRRLGAQ